MEEENKPAEVKNDTITLSKKNLWMYSTYFLIAVVVVVGFLLLNGKLGSTGGTVSGDVDLKVFTSNPSLYPSIGPENAKNVVIEFSDFQCPYCALASGLPIWTSQYQSQYSDLVGVGQKVQQMAEDGKIRLIYVPMSFLGNESIYATEAALCANEQGKFWEMHDAIFAAHDNKENNGKYSKDNLKIFAAGIDGIDINKFNDCLDNNKMANSAQQVMVDFQKTGMKIQSPIFYVNGKKLPASWTQISAELSQ